MIRYAVISGLKLPDKHLGSYQYGSQGGWMCCNIHYLSAEQTPRQCGWMCCNVNHLNAKQTPSIISCSDVLIVFYFRTHFLIVCMIGLGRALRAEGSSVILPEVVLVGQTKKQHIQGIFRLFKLLLQK